MSKIIDLQKTFQKDNLKINDFVSATIVNLKKNKALNAYISLIEKHQELKNKTSDSLLYGIPYAIKDNINVFGTFTTGGSRFFENYKSCYDATVISLLNDSGAVPVVKANLDEFGLGGTGTFSGYGRVINPLDQNRITSGSSSGSAVLVADDSVPFALGTDTGDSIRKPASYLGIIGYKPTYGLVSRYGVFPYAPSLDHVGLLAKSVTDIAIVADVICKYDENDFTSQRQDVHNFYKNINNLKDKYKLVYFKNIIKYMDDKCKNLFIETISKLKNEKKIEICEIDFPEELISAISSIYKIISYSEAVSCYQNITGIPFGKKINSASFFETIAKTRSKYFGNELKRRFVFGSYCTLKDNYLGILFLSKKIRRIIVEKASELFAKYDFVVMPGSSSYAPTIDELENKIYKDTYVDDYLQIANFGGFPSLTLPMGKVNDNYIGINFMGNINYDQELLIFCKFINEKLNAGD